MGNNGRKPWIRFSNSKIYKINRKLNERPYKYIYKELLPKPLYRSIQKKVDIVQQKHISEYWGKVIEEYMKGNYESLEIIPRKDIGNEKVIWQYWGTGWENGELPHIVELCRKSLDRHNNGYEIIRLDDRSINDYIEMPQFIVEKKERGIIPFTFFSDILRLALLNAYGGVWLDATVMLTGGLPERYREMDYFMFQRSEENKDREYWEKMNRDYFSWDEGHMVRVLNSIIFSRKGSKVIGALLTLLLLFWEYNDSIPHYFFFQIMYNELMERHMIDLRCAVVDDTLPHMLFSRWNEEFSHSGLESIKERTSMHKLTHKNVGEEQCRKGSFYDYFRKEYSL